MFIRCATGCTTAMQYTVKESCAKTFQYGHYNTFWYLSIKPQSFRRMTNFLLQKIGTYASRRGSCQDVGHMG